jgi:hypothetical protein
VRIKSALQPDDLMVVLEGSLYLFLVVLCALALQLDWITLGTGVTFSVCLLTGLIFLAWKRFDGGRHPCFLFLAMLMIFQGGRLIGYVFGFLDDPFQIVVETAIPFGISASASRITLLLITLSAFCVYLPTRWRFTPVRLDASSAQEWLPAAYLLLALTFPFMFYKNYIYLSYIRSHGGYLAVFTDNDAIVGSAGGLVRAISLIAYNVFLIIFVLERRRKFLVPVTILFLATTALELLIGFRGKVFLLLITLWYLNNLKKGARFRLLPLVASVAVLSLLAVLTAGFRENKEAETLSPIAFIAGQGTSLGVTEVAVEYRDLFRQHAASYLLNSIETAYKSSFEFGDGQLFDNDLSIFLNRFAFHLGFATGSAYLAEAYLVGGTVFVILVSIGIGIALRILHIASVHTSGNVMLVVFMPGLIYLPRTGLMDPLAAGIRSIIAILAVCVCLWIIRRGADMFSGEISRSTRDCIGTDTLPQ